MAMLTRLTHFDPARCNALAGLLCDAVASGASIGFLADLDLEAARRYWASLSETLEQDVLLWVAEEQGALLGSVQLGLCHKPNGRHRAEVQKLMVDRAARGRGIGAALLAAAESAAQQDRRHLLVLDTEAGSAAERLYQRHGWQIAGSIPDFACSPGGGLRPTVIYWKRLAQAAAAA